MVPYVRDVSRCSTDANKFFLLISDLVDYYLAISITYLGDG